MCIFTWAYFNRKNKHEQKCEVVVIRSAGLSTKQQQGFIQPGFTPLVDVEGMKKFVLLYIIIMWLLCGCWPVSAPLSPCRNSTEKVVRGYLKR